MSSNHSDTSGAVPPAQWTTTRGGVVDSSRSDSKEDWRFVAESPTGARRRVSDFFELHVALGLLERASPIRRNRAACSRALPPLPFAQVFKAAFAESLVETAQANQPGTRTMAFAANADFRFTCVLVPTNCLFGGPTPLCRAKHAGKRSASLSTEPHEKPKTNRLQIFESTNRSVEKFHGSSWHQHLSHFLSAQFLSPPPQARMLNDSANLTRECSFIVQNLTQRYLLIDNN